VVASPYSAVVSAEKLLAEAQLVVLADVVSVTVVRDSGTMSHLATARVLETWKGPSRTTIRYLGSPTWYSCDTSDAGAGERVVLFLSQVKGEAYPRITHFGRGRLPVHTLTGTEVATVYEVVFPRSIPVTRQREYGGTQTVMLRALRTFVRARSTRAAR
jgi:hypothetical protein